MSAFGGKADNPQIHEPRKAVPCYRLWFSLRLGPRENACNALKRGGFLRRQDGDIPAIWQNLPAFPEIAGRRVGSRLTAQPPSHRFFGPHLTCAKASRASPELRHQTSGPALSSARERAFQRTEASFSRFISPGQFRGSHSLRARGHHQRRVSMCIEVRIR